MDLNGGKAAGQFAIRKVPGEIPPVGRLSHEAQVLERQIRSMTIPQLQDLLTRQETILKNPKLLQKLPDKGSKVKMKRDVIQKLIHQKKAPVEEAAKMLEALSVQGSSSSKGEQKKVDVDELEWKYGGGLKIMLQSRNGALDSDDDDGDEGAGRLESPSQSLKVLAEKEVPLTKPKKEERDEGLLSPYCQNLSKKSEIGQNKHRFMPFKSAKHESVTEISDKLPKPPERIGGTKKKPDELMPVPPEPKRDSAKLVPLAESVRLLKDREIKMKDLLLLQAARRLAEAAGKDKADGVGDEVVKVSDAMSYRDTNNTSYEGEENEMYDEEQADQGEGDIKITYSVYEDAE